MQHGTGFHLSNHRLEGSLCDTPLARVLSECFDHQITGTLRVSAFGRVAVLELRAGVVDHAEFGEIGGDAAVELLCRLRTGDYELAQRLPDLDGTLGSAAELEGTTGEVSLVALMRHCEDNALSCKIILISDFDRAEILYRAGDIVEVSLNGERDEDRIVDIMRFQRARFRVSAPPLNLDIEGWPACGRAPTAPFVVERDFHDDVGNAEPAALEEAPEAAQDAAEPEAPRASAHWPAPQDAVPHPILEEPVTDVNFRIQGAFRVPLAYVAAGAVLLTGLWLYLMALAIA